MPLPVVALWPWLIGLITTAFTSFTTWLIGRMVYEKAIHYALVTAFIVTAAALTISVSLSIKAVIFAAQIYMPANLVAVTYFLPKNINQVFSIIVTVRVSLTLYRWTLKTMSYYLPVKQIF